MPLVDYVEVGLRTCGGEDVRDFLKYRADSLGADAVGLRRVPKLRYQLRQCLYVYHCGNLLRKVMMGMTPRKRHKTP